MYDAKVVIPALLVFLAVAAFPFWFAGGNPAKMKDPEKPKAKLVQKVRADKKVACIEATAWMRANHMQLLNDWRNLVVRSSKRIYVASDGASYLMSLSNNCLRCHTSKKDFCDRCHNYAGVAPFCWNCHVEPKGAK
ncbi:MAG: sulfate reduction electron transfer complex DsrMKJOP subunit DsrJ [Proteobacteria bacterium]|nr:sulfate reduction electron transfer complex DsrMKJOP subunit DsrJ [Pseudomonadota bacterium]MBU1740271.1 sulfate reduction electron transfer complex DsrMKJOP subunit DsrJ [Pseudomonadota bacterium]